MSVITVTACNTKKEVDLIIHTNTLYTCNNAFDKTASLAIRDGIIVDEGDKVSIESIYRSCKTINNDRAYAYPGFIDAHCHFSGLALTNYQCELKGTKSYQDVLTKLLEYEKTNKLSWVYARGWDQNDWDNKEYPSNEELNRLFPNKPVILKRIDGHALLCNQKALDMAGIDKNKVIDGGKILVKDGILTGILIDNATEPVEKLIGIIPDSIASNYYKLTEKKCFEEGLTLIVDCGVKKNVIEQIKKMYNNHLLTIGNSILLDQEEKTLDYYVPKGKYINDQLEINGIKVYADGALGSRGACLKREYHDMHGESGLILTDFDKINRICSSAKAHQLQVCTHAIGDSANHAILKLYSKFLDEENDLRWRIEHAQVIDNHDISMFSTYNIIPSVQPTHATSDMYWAKERLGSKRIRGAYAYKDLLKQNGWLPLGTDFPVEEISPIATFYAAVFRKDKHGYPENGFQMENALSRKEALMGMTYWAAKSVFRENKKGSIEIGKDSDIVILDTDLMNASEEDIKRASVLMTIVKGKIVYTKKGAE